MLIIPAALILSGLVAFYAARRWWIVLIGYLCIVFVTYLSYLPLAKMAHESVSNDGAALFIVLVVFPSFLASIIGWSVGAVLHYALWE
jgi:hypothetical protein